MSLNSQTNKYCCCRCGVGGYSIGLYAKIREIDTKRAYKELLDKGVITQEEFEAKKKQLLGL